MRAGRERVLIIDPDAALRRRLVRRLRSRGLRALEVDSGEQALPIVRANREIAVIVLARELPGVDGLQALQEMRAFRPELQAIVLSSEQSLEAAEQAGRAGVHRFFAKPADLAEVTEAVGAACRERPNVLARHGLDPRESHTVFSWLLGSSGSRPLFVLLGAIVFALIALGSPPAGLLDLVGAGKTAPAGQASGEDPAFGYADYRKMARGESIAEQYSRTYDLGAEETGADGAPRTVPLTARATASRAQVMLALIVLAALFWATGAAPLGVTAMLIGVVMYFGDVMKPDDIARSFARDAVIFIFGVLAISRAITKTGLDRRLGLLLLGRARNLPTLMFVFLPLLSLACGFISEHALVAFTMPLFVMIYATAVRESNIRGDRALMILFTLSLCYAANVGGPGSPAAGGRNAIMIAILGDYGAAPTFKDWLIYGMPLVPVMSLVVAAYFFLFFRKKIRVKELNAARIVAASSRRIGPITRDEIVTAIVLLAVIVLWIGASDRLGMGGPVLLGLVALNVLRVLHWRDIASIHWDVVFLYAGASALGKGLAATGGALYVADSFLNLLPESMLTGTGLAIAASLFTGIMTNFMSDGAAVSTIGPITVPMAMLGNAHPWMVGFATAYASSFAHMLVIGTPSNALAYAMAKNPVTGRQLVGLKDFLFHGLIVLLICFAVLWLWAFLGYWKWIGFPAV
ncbi:MAG: Sodium-dependent dicarboxylate transporter SdcS [Calditrichaeota bacterium]|nr:Sodium-dependent dicarboxylate transporter SdcS [Calditrichota bacterium]